MSESPKQRKGPGGARAGAGRKVKEVDLAQLEQLCMLHVTDEEIAAFFKVGVRTVKRWKEREEIGAVMEAGRAKGRTTIRRLQMQAAQQGNPAILIWLGKVFLDQKDLSRTEISGPNGGPVQIESSASEALMAALDRIAARKPDTEPEGGTEQ